jgi:molecular chaperone DnaK (HSP70)
MLPNLFIPDLCSHLLSVGDSAKNAFHSNPENTVFDAKRLIGRKMDDNELKRDIKHWPFGVVDKAGKPTIQINYKSETREFVSFASLPTIGKH